MTCLPLGTYNSKNKPFDTLHSCNNLRKYCFKPFFIFLFLVIHRDKDWNNGRDKDLFTSCLSGFDYFPKQPADNGTERRSVQAAFFNASDEVPVSLTFCP
jgi:hypothetical protein